MFGRQVTLKLEANATALHFTERSRHTVVI